jgi:hypothetical protein
MIHLPGVLAAAEQVQQLCQQHGWRFCFIGGVAVQRWGEPRLTQDVDLTPPALDQIYASQAQDHAAANTLTSLSSR